MLKEYLNNLQKSINQGDAREESLYVHLESMVRRFALESGAKLIDITILPKKTEAGNPDFRIWDGKNHITGYIEAKAPGTRNLDWIQETEQIIRYRNTFPNIILTNFYEFRLYREGILIKQVNVGRPDLAMKLQSVPPVENESGFSDLFNTFFSFSMPVVRNAGSLAVELAKRTRFLRDEVVSIEIEGESENEKKPVSGFYEAFRKYLIGTLTVSSFADLYSQTLTYGLFAARMRCGINPDGSKVVFNRETAYRYIPNTIGILRDIFRFISLEDPPVSLKVIVDDIAEVLDVTDINKILHDYHGNGKGKDPIIHFYETFLSVYDPAIREKRGVYYTPEPIVRFIVLSVNQVLKTRFDITDGLAGENVTLLDPAGGTLTFPAEAVRLAVREFTDKYGPGGKSKLIRNHILKNFYAFELMLAPYAIGHLKMSLIFEELGYRLGDDERFKSFLTNALEIEDLEQTNIPGLSSLSKESHLAATVKKEQSVLVMLGNPPYSGMSANPGERIVPVRTGEKYITGYYWDPLKNAVGRKFRTNTGKETSKKQKTFIGDLLMDYYFIDGEKLNEKNPKWLQDDYVKFLRFAQWKIQQAGLGIIGMITNHSYLDNPTFRGMRRNLMNTFNEIYILNLHGNSLKKETSPDGTKDENVFDIRQGTAIAIYMRMPGKTGCSMFYGDLFGLREAKYDGLKSNDLTTINWRAIYPEAPFYIFGSQDMSGSKDYLKWKSVGEIFPVNSVGIVTARDNLAIRWTENDAWNTALQFSKMDTEIARQAYRLGPDTRDWKVKMAQDDLKQSGLNRENVRQILYRPFDIRYTYYTGNSRGFHCMPRPEVMQNLLDPGNNLGLSLSKRVEGNKPWEQVFICDKLITHHSVSLKEVNYVFPLYLIRQKHRRKSHIQTFILFDPETGYEGKIPNIDQRIHEKLCGVYKSTVTPEKILYYVYAILYSTIYREKYAGYLKIDFPRIPFTTSHEIFSKMAEYGNILVDLHLMKSRLPDKPVSRYQGESDDDRITNIAYKEGEHRIYINDGKYFDTVIPAVWNYRIGGYQVLSKYLKDRKNRILDDPRYICRVITAIHETLRIRDLIDEIYEMAEREVIAF